MRPVADNLTRHDGVVAPAQRSELLGHGAACLWFTGLSGSGKSTLARAVEAALIERGALAYVLDGDNLRLGLNADLGFAAEDRRENIRRVRELAGLFVDSGLILLTAFISPYRADRDEARTRLGERFHEIHVDPGLGVCEARDPKGLYQRARAGEIADFTGISAPYEAPEAPELRVDTGSQDLARSVDQVLAYLEHAGVVSPR